MTTRTRIHSDRVETAVLAGILTVVAVAAGWASFTHVHDWTMRHAPTGTPDAFGWVNVAEHAHGGLRFHDLRHSYATWLVSDGVPVNVVQHVMGHEQASTTLNRYTHTPDDFAARVRAALDDPAASVLPFEPKRRGVGDRTGDNTASEQGK